MEEEMGEKAVSKELRWIGALCKQEIFGHTSGRKVFLKETCVKLDGEYRLVMKYCEFQAWSKPSIKPQEHRGGDQKLCKRHRKGERERRKTIRCHV